MVITRSTELKKRPPPSVVPSIGGSTPTESGSTKKSKPNTHIFFDTESDTPYDSATPYIYTEEDEISSESDSELSDDSESSDEDSDEDDDDVGLYDSCLEELNNHSTNRAELFTLIDQLNQCRTIIKSKDITIEEILKASIPIDKKASFIERYVSFKSSTLPGTEDYIFERDKLKESLRIVIEQFELCTNGQETTNSVGGPSGVSTQKPLSDDIQLHKKINELNTTQENRNVIHSKLEEYLDHIRGEEKSKLKRWLTTAVNLPYDKSLPPTTTEENKTILFKFKTYLDEKLYGMEKVKERLLIFLNKKLTLGSSKGCTIALVGPPGHGKTEISRAIGHALGIPFCQVSCGGMSTSDFLMGHDYTYTGSREGEITRCLTQNGVKNGILFFDEFEKISSKKDIVASLLHITDFTQNHQFKDHYLPELKQDLSKTWFIFSMNGLPEDDALKDRLDVIYVDPYNTHDKQCITRDYIFKKYLKEYPDLKEMVIPEEVSNYIVEIGGSSQGIRGIERMVSVVLEKFFFYSNNKDREYTYPWFTFLKKCKEPTITKDFVALVLQETKDQSQPKHMSMYL